MYSDVMMDAWCTALENTYLYIAAWKMGFTGFCSVYYAIFNSIRYIYSSIYMVYLSALLLTVPVAEGGDWK